MPYDPLPTSPVPYVVCTDATDRSWWHPKINSLFEYWKSVSTVDCFPGRQHIDPVSIPSLLESICLIDVIRSPRRYRFRLFGSRIARAYDFEATGKFFDTVYQDMASLQAVLDCFDQVADQAIAMHCKYSPKFVAQKKHLTVETLNLPLARDGRTVDMILSGLVFTDSTGRELR